MHIHPAALDIAPLQNKTKQNKNTHSFIRVLQNSENNSSDQKLSGRVKELKELQSSWPVDLHTDCPIPIKPPQDA